MLNKHQRIRLWAVSILTALVGVVNLISAVTPNSPKRIELIEQFGNRPPGDRR
jgi:phosphatidylglycerol lysyltransferase